MSRNIKKMSKLTRTYLRKLIKEELESFGDNLETELEPVEDAWAGGDNLESDIDHPKSAGSEETTKHQEVLPIMDENSLRRLVMDVLLEIDD